MNDKARQQAVQETAKSKFRGKKTLKSKVAIQYKENLEREYRRLTNAYMELLRDTLTKYLPVIKKAANEAKRLDTALHTDAIDLETVIRDTFRAMNIELDSKTEKFLLRSKLEKLSNLTRKLTVKEWKRVVSKTLGIDITDDYYLGEFYRESLKRWTDTNVDLIKSIPAGSLGEMQEIVQSGYATGKSTTSILKEVQSAYGVNKRKAAFLARDQMAKLNADLTQAEQTDAGVTEYIWSSSGDGRVRDRHRFLDGKTFKWSEPPIVDVKTGRRAHPGQDYQCRCVAIPKFDIETLDLPMSGTTTQEGG